MKLEDLYPTREQCEELFSLRQKPSFAYWIRSYTGWHNELSIHEYDYIKVENRCSIYFHTNSHGEIVTSIPAPSIPEMELEYYELYRANSLKHNIRWRNTPNRLWAAWGQDDETNPPYIYCTGSTNRDLRLAEVYAENLLSIYRDINKPVSKEYLSNKIMYLKDKIRDLEAVRNNHIKAGSERYLDIEINKYKKQMAELENENSGI